MRPPTQDPPHPLPPPPSAELPCSQATWPPTAFLMTAQGFISGANFVKLKTASICLSNEPNARPSEESLGPLLGGAEGKTPLPSSLPGGPWRGRVCVCAGAPSPGGRPSEPRLFVFPCKNANQSTTSTQQTNQVPRVGSAPAGGPGRRPEGLLYDQRRF